MSTVFYCWWITSAAAQRHQMLLSCSIFSAPREQHSATRENFEIPSQVSFRPRPNPGDPEHVRA